uniref:ribosomal protein L22 n=1 Tax=Lygodium merrillii TaxID=2991877 RepID=UPI002A7EEA8A|nr:ribosomal protein L22 [Lygodium merrillii]UYS92590.1 ribosomal protein L22 [Lygodium merrillii]
METKYKSEIEAKASLKNIRMSANKVRRVSDRIKGCSYEQALVLLEFMPYKACYSILQLVLSAAANVNRNSNVQLSKSSLFIGEAWVDGATRLKRFQPRAQGRGYPIRKPGCHVTIKSIFKVSENKENKIVDINKLIN